MITKVTLFRGEPIASAHGKIRLAKGGTRQLFHSRVTRLWYKLQLAAAEHVLLSPFLGIGCWPEELPVASIDHLHSQATAEFRWWSGPSV